MDNQQLCNLNNDQLQVLLTSKLGDGCIYKGNSNKHFAYITNNKHREYLEFKKSLLGNLANSINYVEHNGYSQTSIYTLRTKPCPEIDIVNSWSLEKSLNYLDELGLALWLYDDGSLHKEKYFYNINTQKYSYDVNKNILEPFLKNKFGIIAKTTIENKKDGREFYYLRVGRHDGSFIISKILSKYPIDCYKYKLWSSETIQRWSKLQVELKSRGIVISKRHFSLLLEKVTEDRTIQDIVRSL